MDAFQSVINPLLDPMLKAVQFVINSVLDPVMDLC
jgi:hypothetical protein